jgi:hypothetical protein
VSELTLIGGVPGEGGLRQDVVLRPMTGRTEMALVDLGDAASNLSQPARVSRFLAETVESVGGAPVDPGALSVGDRQYLVRQIGARLGPDTVWLGGTCQTCDGPFEVPVTQSDLPVKPAGPGYPQTRLSVEGTACVLRSPTGADQEAIAGLPPGAAADALFALLVEQVETGALGVEAKQQLEAAIEDLSPEVALEVATSCPECGAALRIEIDPYLALSRPSSDILDEIHLIASQYHWSEAEILALPRARRQAYLARIDRARGMVRAPEFGAEG